MRLATMVLSLSYTKSMWPDLLELVAPMTQVVHHSKSNLDVADEAWYWPKRILRSG